MILRALAVVGVLTGGLAGCVPGLQPGDATNAQANAPTDDPLGAQYVLDDPSEAPPPPAAENTPVQPPVPATVPTSGADAPPAPKLVLDPEPAKVDPNARAHIACVQDGGSFSKTNKGAFICVRPTGDNGTACETARDCDGACLARSGTCAPFIPLLGCHEVLLSNGRQTTECIE